MQARLGSQRERERERERGGLIGKEEKGRKERRNNFKCARRVTMAHVALCPISLAGCEYC